MASSKYKWDGDSRDERLSEFAHSGFSSTTTAGAFNSTWADHRVRRKRQARFAGLLLPLLLAVAASTALLYLAVTHLRG